MKKLTLLLFLISGNLCFAQNDTTYLDYYGYKSSQSSAFYYKFISQEGNDFVEKEIFIKTNMPHSIAECSLDEHHRKNGKCITYYQSGAKESEGYYLKGDETGRWIIWDEDGKDSTIVVHDDRMDGTNKFERISKNQPYNNGDSIATLIEVMPQFEGGEQAMMQFIQKNIQYPQAEKESGISGTCYITFVVEKGGSLSNMKILRGVKGGLGCDTEALRVLQIMPKWKPGKLNGKNIRVRYNLPIKYTLRNKW